MNSRIDLSSISKHENIALQFSGGKDSLACVHLLRPHWDRITLYHVDTGDLLPEVREIVDGVEAMVPHFVRIETNSADWMKRFGLPSDLVPTTCTVAGMWMGFGGRRIVDRFDCCAENIMGPIHRRMLADGVTLAIRGTKRADMPTLAAESGDTTMGYEICLPIRDWSHADVFAYLREVGAPICRVYEHKVNAPECATCPAWWNEGRAGYLKKYHPDLNAAYQAKLALVAAEIAPVHRTLMEELA
ncbi:MAG: phosphoadenosine phosphosulfate reductase family protein [Hyphomonadaceae bacterium]|nr:phosphoadenosine phosphosulfate reductase family protein [Hyphomonadaceae bacterium]